MLLRLGNTLSEVSMRRRRSGSGQTVVLVALMLPALLGANYLPDNPSQALTTANQLAQNNGVKAGEIVSTSVAADNLSISIKLQRTVPYFLAKVLGLSNGIVTTAATATPQFPPSTLNATMPSQVPAGRGYGDDSSAAKSACRRI